MRADLRTLFWLQWRLTSAMFRSRRADNWARLGRLLMGIFLLILSLPFFIAVGVLLALAAAHLSPRGAYELLIMVNTAMLFFWLMMPATYNSEFIERFEMTRLFTQPIRINSLAAGSTLVSLLSFIGLWSFLVLLGEVAGLAAHGLASAPLVLLGALPTFAILMLVGRLMDDVLDLVANDRRLRGLLLGLLGLPFLLLFLGNYYLQYATHNFQSMESFLRPLLGNAGSLRGLSFMQVLDLLLVNLRPSRYLIFLPAGWATASMALPVAGQWGAGVAFLALSSAAAGGLYALHAAIVRRMMQGMALHMSSQRVRSQRLNLRLPGPPALWSLFEKDWAYLRRSPMTRRILLSTPIVAVAFGFAFWQMNNVSQAVSGELPSSLGPTLPALGACLAAISVSLSMCNLTANYFGAIDREGFGGLMLSGVDRRWVWLSANLMSLLFTLAQTLFLLLLVATITRSWLTLPWGLFFALCLFLSTIPAANLTSVLAPHRARFSLGNNNQGNLWPLLSWMITAPPVCILFILPYFLWRPGLAITLPLAALYGVGLYMITLKPLARLLDRRTHSIYEAINGEG
jgi:hypothetical protein